MAISFTVLPHSEDPSREAVEVWQDGKLVAAIYCSEAGGVVGVHLVSKYLGRCHKPDTMSAVAILEANVRRGPRT